MAEGVLCARSDSAGGVIWYNSPYMKVREIHVRAGLFAVSLLAMLLGYHLLLTSHAPSVFNDALEDMSYGWYVPVFSL